MDYLKTLDYFDENGEKRRRKPNPNKLEEIVDLKYHDKVLLDNWNSVVRTGDTVYHLGDFGFGINEYFLRRLNGNIVLLKGNHDKGIEKYSRYFQHLWAEAPLNRGVTIEGEKVVLNHYPMLSWKGSYYSLFGEGPTHLFGHIHSDGTYNLEGPFIKHPASCDVGVDAWNYTPTNLEAIKERISNQKKMFFEKFPNFLAKNID